MNIPQLAQLLVQSHITIKFPENPMDVLFSKKNSWCSELVI